MTSQDAYDLVGLCFLLAIGLLFVSVLAFSFYKTRSWLDVSAVISGEYLRVIGDSAHRWATVSYSLDGIDIDTRLLGLQLREDFIIGEKINVKVCPGDHRK